MIRDNLPFCATRRPAAQPFCFFRRDALSLGFRQLQF